MICCLDLEGVLVPEIWIQVAKHTKIKELRLTTRDEPNYDLLMQRRLAILRSNGIKLKNIQQVIERMKPLAGALGFLKKLRAKQQVVILSDTYYEFATPILEKLGQPTLFCNRLSVDQDGFIANYHLRQESGKEKAVGALRAMGFKVKAAGDSYNDLAMLKAADQGVLFNPPPQIVREFPEFPVAKNYPALLKLLVS